MAEMFYAQHTMVSLLEPISMVSHVRLSGRALTYLFALLRLQAMGKRFYSDYGCYFVDQ